ncbi:MAG: hypothetical protein BGO96_06350 [Micrococcales bacterium 73-15]|nr:MAG: hypothetical protein BGO96_06350 [Micrococcales bacterium 73-15]
MLGIRFHATHFSGTLGLHVAVESVIPSESSEVPMGSVIKKRRKRMAKKKHRKLLRKTRHQRRNKK